MMSIATLSQTITEQRIVTTSSKIIDQSINQSNFYSANIPGAARSVFKCEVVEAKIDNSKEIMDHISITGDEIPCCSLESVANVLEVLY